MEAAACSVGLWGGREVSGSEMGSSRRVLNRTVGHRSLLLWCQDSAVEQQSGSREASQVVAVSVLVIDDGGLV